MGDLRARVDSLLQDGLRRRLFTGAAVAVRTPSDLLVQMHGKHSQAAAAVGAASLFDLASLTKMFTACAVSDLIADRIIDPDAPVADVLRVGSGDAARAITMRMLLTHTAGLPAESSIWRGATRPRPDELARVLAAAVDSEPGSRFRYSCLGYIAAGAVAEKATGVPIDRLIADRVLRRLELNGTTFGPVPSQHAVATEDQSFLGRGLVQGSVHDELAWYLGGRVGNAGLFAPIGDVLRFAEELRSPRRLDPSVHELMTTSSLNRERHHAPFGHGLGPRIGDLTFMANDRSFGHTGFTGTMLVIDPERMTAAVLLTNRVHPVRARVDLTAFRLALNTLVMASADEEQ
jgi:CubicO group peptidase (beta-lactamase class C family)